MSERSQLGVADEDDDDSTVTDQTTISELVTSLRSAFQKAAFARVAEVLVRREDKLKKEIEGKDEENKLLREKLQFEALEKLKYQKECAKLEVLASRLREERDGLLKRLEENADDRKDIFELKRKNRELESAKLSAETQVDLCNGRFNALEEKLLNLEKEFETLDELGENGEKRDALVNLPLDTNADNKRPLSSEIVEIVDSGDEVENDEALHKRVSASSADVNGSCPLESCKRVKTQEHVPIASPIKLHSPAALKTQYPEKVDVPPKLSKLLSELGDDSSSSSGSDSDLDLSVDYSAFIRTGDL